MKFNFTQNVFQLVLLCLFRSSILYFAWNWVIISELELQPLSFALCFVLVSLILFLFKNPELSKILMMVNNINNIMVIEQLNKLLSDKNFLNIQKNHDHSKDIDKDS